MKISDLKKIDEAGVFNAIKNVYRNTQYGQDRATANAAASAQDKFEQNIAILIARAIQSGSVIQRQTPAQSTTSAQPEPSKPTAQDMKPMNPAQSADNAAMATGTNESKQYKIFNSLLEALINDDVSTSNTNSATSSLNFKPGAIAQTINQYIVALARKYRWQDNAELKTNAERISQEIEGKLSDSQIVNKISQALQQKNTQKIAQIIQTNTKELTDQLFNTMYQWEQVGQDTGNSEQMQRYQSQLDKMSDFLKKASQNPNVMKTPEGQEYLEAMGILAQQATKNDAQS